MDFQAEYRSKRRTPAEAGRAVKNGDWVQSGRVIVMTTQVPHEGSAMEVYQVGHRAKRELGLIEAYSMTSEAVVTKLMWILGQTDDYAEICRMFQTPVQKDQIY